MARILEMGYIEWMGRRDRSRKAAQEKRSFLDVVFDDVCAGRAMKQKSGAEVVYLVYNTAMKAEGLYYISQNSATPPQTPHRIPSTNAQKPDDGNANLF